MRIAIDASCLLKELTGIGVYTYSLVRHLQEIITGDELLIWVNGLKGSTRLKDIFTRDAVTVKRTRIPGKLLLSCWKYCSFPVVEDLIGPVTVFHSPNFFFHPHTRDTKTVATIHDLFFLRHPEKTEKYGGRYFGKVLIQWIDTIDHIIAVSHTTKKDIIEYFAIPSDKVSVIYHGIDPRFFETPVRRYHSVANQYHINKPYCIAVGTIEPRKNYPFLIRAFAAWRKLCNRDSMLVIVGREGWGFEDVYKAIDQEKARDWLRILQYVGQDELHVLYSNAKALVFPTLYEGFGFPAVEALACGTPVIASNTASLPEVLGDAGLFFEVNNKEEFWERLNYVFEQEDSVRNLITIGKARARMFTWQEAALLTYQVYKDVAHCSL